MKAVIVYYSLEGNTKMIANRLAKDIDADLLQIEPVKKYPTGKITKYLSAGKSATMKEAPKLEQYHIDLSVYDTIIFGTPVWAGTFAPPLRTFIQENDLKEKRVAAFACTASESAGKAFSDFEELLSGKKLIDKVRFTDPYKGREKKLEEKISNFEKEIRSERKNYDD